MPKFYIGSTSIVNLEKGYRGSVSSERYGKLWQNEVKQNPHLFEVEILQKCLTREEAYGKELEIQKHLDVVKSTEYVNLSYARLRNFGACGEKHPFAGKTKENSEIIAKMSKSLSETIKGQTKETCQRVRKRAETISGRTKEEYAYLAQHSEIMSGRTKETHEGVKASADAQRGRTKETHEGVKASADAQRGRTKETHEYLNERSKKRMGKNKSNCDFMKQISEKLRILTDEQELLLYNMKKERKTNAEILEYFCNLGINMKYPTVSTIFSRINKQFKDK